jgi:superoxide dismutase, Fe-Mn family
MAFELPKLPYDYNALEPFIDEQTMTIHHTKHHQTYVDKLNDVVKQRPELENETLEELLFDVALGEVADHVKTTVRNNAGGHWNHSFFWDIMAPHKDEPNLPIGEIAKLLGDFEKFKADFTKVAMGRFGSGWVWLLTSQDGISFDIVDTPNQDNPLMDDGNLQAGEAWMPILGLDVWEHSYYLKYQNRRQEYVENWFNVVNWTKVEENYKKATE